MKLIAMMTMMILTMMMMASAAPLYPSSVPTSHGDQVTPLPNEEGNATMKDTMNITIYGYNFSKTTFRRCVLPTCGTANLGSALQVGDEKAGSATNDPYGNGKK